MKFPKPERPERGTKAAREYMDLAAQLGCACCGRSPVVLHHPIAGRGSQRRASDLDVIPLHPECHDRLHSAPASWFRENGLDTDHIAPTRAAVARLKEMMV